MIVPDYEEFYSLYRLELVGLGSPLTKITLERHLVVKG
jgi:hypothetical protein